VSGGGGGAQDIHTGANNPGTTEWNLTAVLFPQSADPVVLNHAGTQLNVMITYIIPAGVFGNGSVITFTTQPHRVPPVGVLNELGAGIASSQNSFALHHEGHPGRSVSSAVMGEAINAFGFATPEGSVLPFPTNSIIIGPAAPADFDGDGDIDNADAVIWAETFDEAASGGRTPLMVTTQDDESDGDHSYFDLSFREAIALAADGNHPGEDTIVFAPWVHNITIAPTQGFFTISNTNELNILGPGADQLTINAGGKLAAFNVVGGAATPITSTISDMTLTGATATFGNAAAINHYDTTGSHDLILRGLVIANNKNGVSHGANGDILISDSIIEQNQLHGISRLTSSISSGSLQISDSIVQNNASGGIYARGDHVQIVRTEIRGQEAHQAIMRSGFLMVAR
jgi:hypothetical protein